MVVAAGLSGAGRSFRSVGDFADDLPQDALARYATQTSFCVPFGRTLTLSPKSPIAPDKAHSGPGQGRRLGGR